MGPFLVEISIDLVLHCYSCNEIRLNTQSGCSKFNHSKISLIYKTATEYAAHHWKKWQKASERLKLCDLMMGKQDSIFMPMNDTIRYKNFAPIIYSLSSFFLLLPLFLLVLSDMAIFFLEGNKCYISLKYGSSYLYEIKYQTN